MDSSGKFSIIDLILAIVGKIFRIAKGLVYRVYRRLMAEMVRASFRRQGKRDIVITSDLFLEENTSPQDGFELFKYIYTLDGREFEPYYIINKKSSQYRRIKDEYGKHIVGFSAKNRTPAFLRLIWLFRRTKYICSGFLALNALNIDIVQAIKSNPETYYIFTQHGITFFKDDFISVSTYSSFVYDKLMVSNDYEKNIYLSKDCVEEQDIIKNGLFRWDLLTQRSSEPGRTIFIYFTHRRYLKRIPDVEHSVYIQTISGLLRDPRLKELVERYGYTVKVGMHHTAVDLVGPSVLKDVQIISDDDIAEVKRTSDILITDYSSMAFEMWFQRKPAIFLNIPDGEDCILYGSNTDLVHPYRGKEQYLFNIVDSVDDCIALMETYFNNGFTLSEEDNRKVDNFFYYSSDFCQRFYQYLLEQRDQKKALYQVPFNTELGFRSYSNLNTKGITPPTELGRWIFKKKAKVGFYIPQTDKDVSVRIGLSALILEKQNEVSGDIYVNGRKMETVYYRDQEDKELILEIPNSQIRNNYIEIAFHIGKCYRQNELGATNQDDRRRLSLRLQTLQVIEHE